MKLSPLMMALGIASSTAFPALAQDRASDPYAYVSTYVRALAANEDLRARAASEFAAEPSRAMTICVASSRRFELELASEIGRLQQFDFQGALSGTPATIATLIDQKRQTQQAMGAVCEKAAAAVAVQSAKELGAASPQIAKLGAELEFNDKAIFDSAPLVFFSLVDPQPDALNHMSRLVITKTQVDALVKQIDGSFGAKLNEKQPNYIVSAAWLLREGLTKKGYKPKP